MHPWNASIFNDVDDYGAHLSTDIWRIRESCKYPFSFRIHVFTNTHTHRRPMPNIQIRYVYFSVVFGPFVATYYAHIEHVEFREIYSLVRSSLFYVDVGWIPFSMCLDEFRGSRSASTVQQNVNGENIFVPNNW